MTGDEGSGRAPKRFRFLLGFGGRLGWIFGWRAEIFGEMSRGWEVRILLEERADFGKGFRKNFLKKFFIFI